jgi:hypothetical protein
MKLYSFILVAVCMAASSAKGQPQVNISRIEMMPRFPHLYEMRCWREVATRYDSMAFDMGISGQYLPLAFLNSATVNYSAVSSFGLHTYVGDARSGASGEAINVLPALVGASLCGIDKRSQFGLDWVLKSREYFNNRAAENVYLNSPASSSGSDWWYDVMPNIFFYQLYSRYPETDDYGRQFAAVADQWLKATYAMGASLTPWSHPGLEHRGWSLASMSPNNQTPYEPEAGGSIAWVLYHASLKTGNPEYRYGAELCLEELNAYTSNPAYELQLSYGALVAARMNAEQGTAFDVEKMANWCFNVSPIRSWGAIVGTWGGRDCSGLIGEVNGVNDYAFAMNTFEQIGALVPMVRYDPRFARAIGRWVLNAANASRLFYGGFLPDANQDGRPWSSQYDTLSVIAHEALRQTGNGGVSPYATGDAVQAGWAPTNLSLYSSSHVGILGAIIDTTNVRGILKLDLLATDYFRAPAYPSYLLYNPDSLEHTVEMPLAGGSYDIYDAVSKQLVLSGTSSLAHIPVPADGAVVAVILPAGGLIAHQEEKFLVNGRVVDFHSGVVVSNHHPRIKGLGVSPRVVYLGGMAQAYCTATDRDGDSLTYIWNSSAGSHVGTGPSVTWTAPMTKGGCTIRCIVTDGKGENDTATATISVVDSALSTPVIRALIAHPGKVDSGGSSTVLCSAVDPKGLPLTYIWSTDGGTITGSDSSVHWTAPGAVGNWSIHCTVSNTQGGRATDSVLIPVRDFSLGGSAGPVLSLPFTGSISDVSGYGNPVAPTDVILVGDRFGTTSNAGGFNGGTSCLRITNSSRLDFDSAITVSLWMKPGILPAKETFLISHGSWQNRWKISITPGGKIRWTVKTAAGVKDLDSRTTVASGVYHQVAATFNGSDLELYVDGDLEAFATWSGRLLTTAMDMTVGQMLPSDAAYNFAGVIDDIQVHDYALTYLQIQTLYSTVTGLRGEDDDGHPTGMKLFECYPNPFNPVTSIGYTVGVDSRQPLVATKVRLAVYDLLGREVAVLVDETRQPGRYEVKFDGSGLSSGVYICRMGVGRLVQTHKLMLLR